MSLASRCTKGKTSKEVAMESIADAMDKVIDRDKYAEVTSRILENAEIKTIYYLSIDSLPFW